jgi:S-adenosylmethionine hydrolase
MTDFDLKDDAVGLCKAVVDGIAPSVRIIDITHQVMPYAVEKEQGFLAGTSHYFADTFTVDSAGLHGEVIGTDGSSGNLVLNIPRRHLLGSAMSSETRFR